MKDLPDKIDAATTRYLEVLDSFIDSSMVLISDVCGARGVTETHAPVSCRFCGAKAHYSNINHSPECKFVILSTGYHQYRFGADRRGVCLLLRYEATLAYCDTVVAFLEDPEVLAVIETDDRGQSNVEKLQPLYEARDQYLTTFPRGR